MGRGREALSVALLVVAAGGSAGALWGAGARWGSGAHRAPVTHTVTIDATRYEPARLVVRPGDTIVWVNADLLPHTATATGGAFDSDVIVRGARWRFTANAAGDIDYACTFHPTMTGRLEIR
jgi:plastocyanin